MSYIKLYIGQTSTGTVLYFFARTNQQTPPRVAGHSRQIKPGLRGLWSGGRGGPRARELIRIHSGTAAGRVDLVNFRAQGLSACGAVAFHREKAQRTAQRQAYARRRSCI